jgi:hypothetical protein
MYKPSSTKLANTIKWLVIEMLVDSSIVIPKYFIFLILSKIYVLAISEMQKTISTQVFSS